MEHFLVVISVFRWIFKGIRFVEDAKMEHFLVVISVFRWIFKGIRLDFRTDFRGTVC